MAAQDYIGNKNFKKAIELLEEALALGENYAAVLLGELYSEGLITKNGGKAEQCFKIAIASKYEVAMVKLARLYLSGEIIAEDLRQTYLLAKKAASLEYPDGKELLADCYEFGFGTRKNSVKAAKLHFELGPEFSNYNKTKIAEYFIEGRHIEKDIQKALKLLKEASDDGYWEASQRLGYLYKSGGEVERDDKIAFDYFERASVSEGASVASLIELGISYYYGNGCMFDHKLAEFYFRKAYEESTLESYKMQALVYIEDYLKKEI